MAQHIYIASQDANGGILHCSLTREGKLEVLKKYAVPRPSYFCTQGDRMYALLREPFVMHSGVAAFRVAPDGSLTQEGEVQPTHGAVASHIFAREDRVYVTNYLTGSTILLPDRMLAHTGKSVDPRQDCSHPHCLTPTPDGKYLCICDLGTDSIYVCDLELVPVSIAKTPAGSGPRHMVFSPKGDYAYSVNEIGCSVSVYAYEDGKLRYLSSHSTLPEDFTELNYAGAIRISEDGTTLYASNRGHDSVAIFDVEGSRLSNLRHYAAGGSWPWDIVQAGDYMLCGNDHSGTVTVLSLKEGGKLVDTLEVAHPWCVFVLNV